MFRIAAKTHLNKLRVLQVKSLRKITGLYWYMKIRDIERDHNVPTKNKPGARQIIKDLASYVS